MPPLKLRVLWWIMLRAEALAGWCRARWVKWHDTRGAMLPDDTPMERPKR